MYDQRLELICQYCDTSRTRLYSSEKDLLCMILEDPHRYDGFVSRVYEEEESSRDYRDTWHRRSTNQYTIYTMPNLRIDQYSTNSCDGYVSETTYHITELREIIKILRLIEDEL